MNQTEIAKQVGISQSYLSKIISRKRIPPWRVAKKIAEITHSDPLLWLAGTKEGILKALRND